MRCSYCNKEIVLVPSAAQRAERFGGKPSDYTRMFTIHSHCAIEKRNKETSELIKRR